MTKAKRDKKKKNINKKIDFLLLTALLVIVAGILMFYFASYKNKRIEKAVKDPLIVEMKKLNILDINSTYRPYAVMINNIGAARPLQSGLQDAYIIYELIVEGGLTRYLALFIDADVERIGSIRSARHYFLDYALENDAFYVHHGQSPQAQSDFSKLGIDRIVIDSSKTGWRDRSLGVSSEHTLFSSTEKLSAGIGSKRGERKKDFLLNYDVDSLNLSAVPNQQLAINVEIEYSNNVKNSYEYDLETKTYKRFVNGKEHIDYVTKKQYTFKNIITYQVSNTSIAGDSSGRQDLRNIGQGKGYYISEGIAVPISWSKPSRSAKTSYKYEDGKDLIVNDGNTFIQIQPTNRSLKIS